MDACGAGASGDPDRNVTLNAVAIVFATLLHCSRGEMDQGLGILTYPLKFTTTLSTLLGTIACSVRYRNLR